MKYVDLFSLNSFDFRRSGAASSDRTTCFFWPTRSLRLLFEVTPCSFGQGKKKQSNERDKEKRRPWTEETAASRLFLPFAILQKTSTSIG